MELLQRINGYLRYRLAADTPHGIHSPFIFEFMNDLLLDTTPYYPFEPIEAIRSKLLLDKSMINVTDLGAGSGGTQVRKEVREICRNGAVPAKYGRLLFKLVNRFQPTTLLEMGTSLGISGLYMAMANQGKMITLEGCPETSRIATTNFRRLKADHVQCITGDFSTTLKPALQELQQVDFAYIDGNHRYESTVGYFESILPYTRSGTVLVFDDIHWSRGMEHAWEQIRSHASSTLTVDLYRFGIVFFREGVRKQHFTLKF